MKLMDRVALEMARLCRSLVVYRRMRRRWEIGEAE